MFARVNLRHPLIAEEASHIADIWEQLAVPEEARRNARDAESADEAPSSSRTDVFEVGERRLLPIFALSRAGVSAPPDSDQPLRVIPFGDESAEKTMAAVHLRTFLEMTVLGTTGQLLGLLREALYIGPLRTLPPRGFLYERAGGSQVGLMDSLRGTRCFRTAWTSLSAPING